MTVQAVCIECGQDPENISSVCAFSREEGMKPSEWVRREEGTYNPENGHFLCDPCFVSWESKHQKKFIGVAP